MYNTCVRSKSVPFAHCSQVLSPYPAFSKHWFVFCPCRFAFSRISCKRIIYTMKPFGSGFLHVGQCFWDSSMFSYTSIVHSFLWLSRISWRRHTTIGLSIPQLWDMWIISSVWQLRMKWLWAFVYRILCEHMFSFLLGQHWAVELLDHMINLCLTLLTAAFEFFVLGYVLFF